METDSDIPRPLIGEPHFEEDWTVQEARPVVPLETIKAAKNRRFTFRLLGAFAVAVLLGAVTAIVTIRLKQTPPITTSETVAIVDDKPSAVTEESVEPESEVRNLDDQPTDEEETESSQPVTLAQPKSVRPVKPVQEVKTRTQQLPEIKPEVNNVTQPRPILVDQWEERRLRRVQRRERRERRAQRSRDLMRIDELFEGHRPN